LNPGVPTWCYNPRMTTIKLRTVVYLDVKERKALDRISAETGAPVAALVRKAITEWLKKNKKGDKR
jgi:hypothetical protein